MWRIFFIVLIIFGFITAVGSSYTPSAAQTFPADGDDIPVVTEPDGSTFSQTGTLVFYPNNVGPVPYLFYTDQKGNNVAKALVFSGSSPINFSSWTGARISITGTQVMEHVVVSEITYVSGP